MAQQGLQTVWVLYTGFRYDWGPLVNGLTLTWVGIMAAIVQGYLIRKIIPRIGERKAVIYGFALSATMFLMYGLATQGWMLMVAITIGSLAGIAGPATQGIISGTVKASEQGKIQGALTSVLSISSFFSPLLLSLIHI